MVIELDNSQERIEQLQSLKEMVMELSMIHDLDDLFWHIALETSRLLNAEDCAVLLMDPETKQLTFRTTRARNVGITVPNDSKSLLLSVYRTQLPRRTANAPAEPDFNPSISEHAGLVPRTLLAVPILLRGKSIGVIEVINRHAGEFSVEDEDLLSTIAVHVASSVENAWLHQAAEKRLSDLSTLVQVIKAISVSPDLDSLFGNVSTNFMETTGLNEFTISAWDQPTDRLITMMSCIQSEYRFYGDSGPAVPLNKYPITKEVLETGRMKIIRMDSPESLSADLPLHPDRGVSAAVMILPLIVRNSVLGIMEIYFSEENQGLERRTNLFQSIANQIAGAIEITRLHEKTRRHAAELEEHVRLRTVELEQLYAEQAELAKAEREQRKLAETLREAGAIVASNLDPGRAIGEILNQLARVVPHDSASVQLLNDNELVIVGGGGWLERNRMQGYRFAIPGANPNTLVIERLEPVIMNEEELQRYPEFKAVAHSGIKSWLGVPLITQNTVIGMLTLDSQTDGYFTEQHASLASAFADQVGVAIEQAILFQKTQAALAERDALRSIVTEITNELDLPTLLSAVMLRACELLDASGAEIGLYRENHQVIEVVADHNMGEGLIGEQIPLGKGLLGQVAQHRKPIRLANYEEWKHALPSQQGQQWRAVMGAPLTHQQRLIGVIAMADKRAEKRFSQSDLQLLLMLAQQVAIAIENAQLFEQVQILATTDELTGLLNRRELFRRGGEIFRGSQAAGTPLTAVMFDIDLFKLINDTYGHSIGDQVLKGLADCCRSRLREDDLLCRYGGEEFTLVLPATDFDTAIMVAERLRRAIESTPMQTDRGEILITVSFGVAGLQPEHASLATLIDEADAAMYLAKNLGRNRVEGFVKAQG